MSSLKKRSLSTSTSSSSITNNIEGTIMEQDNNGHKEAATSTMMITPKKRRLMSEGHIPLKISPLTGGDDSHNSGHDLKPFTPALPHYDNTITRRESKDINSTAVDHSLFLLEDTLIGSDYTKGDGKSCGGYSKTDLNCIDVCCQNSWSTVNDIVKILEIGTIQGFYLPENRLKHILNKLDSLQHSQDNVPLLNKLYSLLLTDLSYRPIAASSPLSYPLIKTLLEKISDNIEGIISQSNTDSLSYFIQTTTTANQVSLYLKLHYVLKVLIKCLQTCTGEETHQQVTFEIEKLLKSSLLRTVVKFVFILNRFMTANATILSTISDLYEELWTLLCLPIYVSMTKTSEVVTLLTEKLGTVNSIEECIRLLQYIPSNLLLEKVIDLHLEKSFSFHESAHKLYDTQLYQCSESSLTKLCCVHLCRMPCQDKGDLSYLLFLLTTLLRSILLRETGNPPVSLFALNGLDSRIFVSGQQVLDVLEFQGTLASVKSHVLQFIDRLTEDASLLESLIQKECWFYCHLLGNMTDLVAHQNT